MARPSWVLIVGLIMTSISGCGGIFSDLKQLNTKALVELGNDISIEISTELDTIPLSDSERAILNHLTTDTTQLDEILTGQKLGQLLKENTRMSDEAQSTFIRHGYMGLVFSFLFVIFGLLMIFSNKSYVIKGTFALLVVSLLFLLYQIIDLRDEDMAELMKQGQRFNLLMGGLIDLLLLLICGKSNKEYFQPYQQAEDYYD